MSIRKVIFSGLLFITGVNFTQFIYAHSHVLLIGIDGARRDAFNLVLNEQINQHKNKWLTDVLVNDGAIDNAIYAGGEIGEPSQQFTFSEPGWTTILTGVWAYHHHIRFNLDIKRSKYNHDYPTIYNYIKHYLPDSITASYTDWQPMQTLAGYNYFGHDAADINRYYNVDFDDATPAIDKLMTSEIVQQIKLYAPDFTYVHYDNPDAIGHRYGFDPNIPQYLDGIRQELENVNALVKAVEQSNESWLIILTTDHGGHGNIHGTQMNTDRNIFVVLRAPHTKFSGGVNLPIAKGQVTFVPTILHFLGVKHKLNKLDGDAL